MQKLYYSISEVASELGESVSLIRFWANSFEQFVHPQKNAKGNRLFREEDLQTLRQIHFLVKGKGMTLKGAAQELSADRSKVDSAVRVIESLKAIRAQLVEVKEAL